MHAAAHDFVACSATNDPIDVVEFGSLDINGTVRGLFPSARWWGVDLVAGSGVDEVGDAAAWSTSEPADMVVCCEVFEHTELWPIIVERAFDALRPGGRVVITCAGPGRAAHSAVDGGVLRAGEWYCNVTAADLAAALTSAGFGMVTCDEVAGDTRATGVKP